MVQGGMSPWDVLRAATLEPARYFGLLDSLGTVADGKDGRPGAAAGESRCENIENTRRIEAVVANGRLLVDPLGQIR